VFFIFFPPAFFKNKCETFTSTAGKQIKQASNFSQPAKWHNLSRLFGIWFCPKQNPTLQQSQKASPEFFREATSLPMQRLINLIKKVTLTYINFR
jgi:hypothetical protein